MEYYLRHRGKIFGPYQEEQLKSMRIKGGLNRTTELSFDREFWMPADTFEFLYPKPAVATQVDPPTIQRTQTADSSGFMPETTYPNYPAPLPVQKPRSNTLLIVILSTLAVIVLALFVVLFISIFSPDTLVHDSETSSGDSHGATAGDSRSMSTEDIVSKTEMSIACVEGKFSSGTGFLIRPNIIATNKHVIDKDFIELTRIRFPSAPDHQKGPLPVKLGYVDPHWDIAFLEIQSNLAPLKMEENQQFKRGQEIVVIGNPGGLENAVNTGNLSSKTNIEGQTFYQLGISINHGNSGGPVINRYGKVIGIATLKSSVQEGIAFCIPSNVVLDALQDMKQLTSQQKKQAASEHRAKVALRMLLTVNRIYQGCMAEYDHWINVAIEKGLTGNDGIEVASEEIEKRMNAVKYVFMDDVEREIHQITSDTHLPIEFRKKLSEFYANCKEIQSYVDNPRGTANTYKKKLIELVDTGNRLQHQLRLMLGLPDSD